MPVPGQARWGRTCARACADEHPDTCGMPLRPALVYLQSLSLLWPAVPEIWHEGMHVSTVGRHLSDCKNFERQKFDDTSYTRL